MQRDGAARLLSSPAAWVLAQAALIAGILLAAGQFEPRLNPDSATYREAVLSPLPAALSQTRTLGYPLFLRGVRAVAGTDLAAPYFHFAALAGAAAFFGHALRSVGFSRPSAGAAASLLLYSRLVFEQVGDVTADVPAAAAAVVSVSLLLLVTDRPKSAGLWAALSAAVFLTYQIRPAYLFLVPLLPAVAAALAFFLHRRRARSCAGLAVLLGLSTALPLVAFCTLRFFLVGHFGLISFGGYNLVGISGQFLDEELAAELSPEVRPLARRILERRGASDGRRPPAGYRAMEEAYNETVWGLAVPAAEELHGRDAVRVNRSVTALGQEVIRRRPRRYLQWLVWAATEAVRGGLCLFVTDPGVCLCLALLAAAQARVVWRRFRSGVLPPPPPASDRRFVEFNTLLWVAAAFAAAKGLLVILVEPPIGRYLIPAILFAPPALGLLTWYRLTAAFGPGAPEPRPSGSGSTAPHASTAP